MSRVSVVIPTYNSAGTVVRAIESVLAQTYQNFELIVVDDGSTDDTQQQVQPYLNRLTYVWQENQERSAARNHGITISRGEFIAFLDADDWWLPQKLEKQVAALESYPTAGIAYTWMFKADRDENILGLLKDNRSNECIPGEEAFVDLALGRRLTGAGSTALVRRSSLEAAGGFDVAIPGPEDWEFCMRIALYGDVVCVPEPLAIYQLWNIPSLSKLDQRNVQEKHLQVLEKAFALAQEKGLVINPNLKRQAWAHALFYGALVDFYVGKYHSGSQRLVTAHEHWSDYFQGPGSQFVKTLAGVANTLWDTHTALHDSRAFVDVVFAQFPTSLQYLQSYKRAVLGKLYASRVFTSDENEDSWRTVQAVCGAAYHQPSWLKNRGFWSIGARALGIAIKHKLLER